MLHNCCAFAKRNYCKGFKHTHKPRPIKEVLLFSCLNQTSFNRRARKEQVLKVSYVFCDSVSFCVRSGSILHAAVLIICDGILPIGCNRLVVTKLKYTIAKSSVFNTGYKIYHSTCIIKLKLSEKAND